MWGKGLILLISAFLLLGLTAFGGQDVEEISMLDYLTEMELRYGLSFVGNWSDQDRYYAIQGVQVTADALVRLASRRMTPEQAFKAIFNVDEANPMVLERANRSGTGAFTAATRLILFNGLYPIYDSFVGEKSVHLVVHELGHAFEDALEDITGTKLPRYALAVKQARDWQFPDRKIDDQKDYVPNLNYGFAGPRWNWQQSDDASAAEEFADMFLGWVYGRWENSVDGRLRADFMNVYMPVWARFLYIW